MLIDIQLTNSKNSIVSIYPIDFNAFACGIPICIENKEERWLNSRRRGGSMVAHLTANQ
jgi:hypothetical protein